MYTRSGELVTISRVNLKGRWKFLRSLRFRIMLIMILMGIIPTIVVENVVVQSYDNRAVSQRSIIVKNQSDIL